MNRLILLFIFFFQISDLRSQTSDLKSPLGFPTTITDLYMMAGTYGRTNNILLEEVIMTEYGE